MDTYTDKKAKLEEKLHEYERKMEVFRSQMDRAALFRNAYPYLYEGQRDLNKALGYPDDITLEDFLQAYGRQDIAKAIINRPVQATWRGDFNVYEESDAEVSAFEEKWITMYTELHLKSAFIRVDKLACLGNYAVLFLGFNDVNSVDGYLNPVKKGVGRTLLYVKPLGQKECKVTELDTDPTSPRFGMPLFYEIAFMEPSIDGVIATTQSRTIKVHYTRVIHVYGDNLISEYEGEPVLQSVFNRLLDLNKLVGGSAEMFWRGARPGMHGKAQEGVNLTPSNEEMIEQQLEEYDNNLRRFLFTEGLDIKEFLPQVVSPKEHVDVQIQMISAVTGIPKRILTGSEQGELASTQDRDNWNDTIQTRREEYAEHKILRPFINVCVAYGVLPAPAPSKQSTAKRASILTYTIQWPDVYAPSPSAKAEIGHTRASAIKEYFASPYTAEGFPLEAFLTYCLGLTETEVTNILGLMRQQEAMEPAISPEEQMLLEEQKLVQEETVVKRRAYKRGTCSN